VLCHDFFAKYIPPGATVLDIGAGWGEFINNITAGKKYAMDLNPETGVRVASDVVHLRQDSSREWPIPTDSLDVVFTSNFLEHLPDKSSVHRTVAEAHRCLRPGGHFIGLGPNIRHLHGAYWDFWDHRVPLSDASMIELLGICGFEVALCHSRFLPYSMSTSFTPPLLFLRLYLKMPIAWRFVGKQFLIIATKRRCRKVLTHLRSVSTSCLGGNQAPSCIDQGRS
jgi:SAM-dependent methyltransferase